MSARVATDWGNRHELVEVLDLAARGCCTPRHRYPLAAAMNAYDDLAAGAFTGRAVVVPHDYNWHFTPPRPLPAGSALTISYRTHRVGSLLRLRPGPG